MRPCESLHATRACSHCSVECERTVRCTTQTLSSDSLSFKSAEITSTLRSLRDFAASEFAFLVTAFILNLPCCSSASTHPPPCWPVAPRTTTNGSTVIMHSASGTSRHYRIASCADNCEISKRCQHNACCVKLVRQLLGRNNISTSHQCRLPTSGCSGAKGQGLICNPASFGDLLEGRSQSLLSLRQQGVLGASSRAGCHGQFDQPKPSFA